MLARAAHADGAQGATRPGAMMTAALPRTRDQFAGRTRDELAAMCAMCDIAAVMGQTP